MAAPGRLASIRDMLCRPAPSTDTVEAYETAAGRIAPSFYGSAPSRSASRSLIPHEVVSYVFSSLVAAVFGIVGLPTYVRHTPRFDRAAPRGPLWPFLR